MGRYVRLRPVEDGRVNLDALDVPEISKRDAKVAALVEEHPELLHKRDHAGRTLAHVCVGRGCRKVLDVIREFCPDLFGQPDHLGGLPEEEDGPEVCRDLARQTRREGVIAQDRAEGFFS